MIHAWLRAEGEGRAAIGRASAILDREQAGQKPSENGSPTLPVARLIADLMGAEYYRCRFAGHPIETTAVVSHAIPTVSSQVRLQLGLPDAISYSQVASVAGVFDSALHDAYGKWLGLNSWLCLGAEFLTTGIDEFLGDQFRGLQLGEFLSPTPRSRMAVRHRIGIHDPLSPAESVERIGDGLPETLADWIGREGLEEFTVETTGDVREDLARIRSIDAAAAKVHDLFGTDRRRYVLEFVHSVNGEQLSHELLGRITMELPHVFDRISFVRWRGRGPVASGVPVASPIKPAFWSGDDSTVEELKRLRESGFSGIEIQSGLGPTRCIMAALVARQLGMAVAVDEITGPGAAFVQAAGLAARLPGENAIAASARQYWPVAQATWADSHPGLIRVANGELTTESLIGVGLSATPPDPV
ncbi:MAG: hypothetical protein K1X57_03540 [Gemmataceae bacterium]|nr:hypothetical protein [Gemmataceae bacterium]